MSNSVNRLYAKRRKKRRWSDDGQAGSVTYVVPNLFTTANLFAGFYGIVSSINGHYENAAIAILVSCVFDILDGKIARLTKATSRFGVEYDSLADLVAFGVGPGLLMHLWALKPFGRLGWLAAFLFVACGALRLARFNVQAGTGSKKYFTGLPIPGAACMVATTVLFLLKIKGSDFSPVHIVFLLETYGLGFLMVSSIPYDSFKELEVVKGRPLPVLFVLVLLVTVVAAQPYMMLFILFTVYVLSGPVRYVYRKVKRVKTAENGPSAHELPKENGSSAC
ncbi:CDP-diacylglycerol--serine O-phosphatidyltransferase [Desulfosoma caldarium]|uniref:CDP-diacylglycerol--serine O-phosphatidyltransferase n=1 Tax=Desulfosoma caldarium TaxID=610254 RepID=A0A3N1URI8_9BACT|nr:CDP-diacylglycerol--serine O-phosphatidyltransferase [Desulfosoma caldarium]ROQ92338.1 CDP-diacylglycerol--serine O-phosphatidyltransferase [Desulfosoma caldarium]